MQIRRRPLYALALASLAFEAARTSDAHADPDDERDNPTGAPALVCAESSTLVSTGALVYLGSLHWACCPSGATGTACIAPQVPVPDSRDACCEETAGHMAGVAALLDATARQPSAAEVLRQAAQALSSPVPIKALCCKAQLWRMSATGSLYGDIAMQPAAAGDLIASAAQLMGSRPGPNGTWQPFVTTCCEGQAERMENLAQLFSAMARQPSAIDSLRTAAALSGSPPAEPCCLAEAARMDAMRAVFDASARNPEVMASLVQAALQFAGPPDATLCCEAQAARLAATGNAYEGCARQPAICADLTNAGLQLLGAPPPVDELCPSALEQRNAALGLLYDAIARNPAATQALLQMGAALAGSPPPNACARH